LIPFAVSIENLLLSYQVNGIYKFWIVDQRDPLPQYSRTIAKLGGLVHAPKNITILGCLSAYIAPHSLKKSLTPFYD
jgi:hypothetical protein